VIVIETLDLYVQCSALSLRLVLSLVFFGDFFALSYELLPLYYVIEDRGCRFDNDTRTCYTGFNSRKVFSWIKRLVPDFKFLNLTVLTTD
jgi:hypothetical protein